MPFDGLRVLSLESRRCVEIERLIRGQRGEPFVAPSMRELPLSDNPQALEFAERLFRGDFDMMILMTGVGTRLLGQIIETKWPAGSFAEALRKLTVVARGPKPMTVLREWNVPAAIVVGEPNTRREIVAAIEGRPEKRIALQEYGRPSTELIETLRARGAEVSPVSVYQWGLPENCAPLREAVRRLAGGGFDVVLFTTSIQVSHLFRVAAEARIQEDEMQRALRRTVIASIGPSTTETLADFGLKPDLVPSHPRMGFLVNEAAAQAARLIASKHK